MSRPGAGVQRWQERLDDPDEPLFTVGIVADLLGIDSQALRRLGEAISHASVRPSGNQRRYSRRDIEHLAAALELSRKGHSAASINVIVELQYEVARLSSGRRNVRA